MEMGGIVMDGLKRRKSRGGFTQTDRKNRRKME